MSFVGFNQLFSQILPEQTTESSSMLDSFIGNYMGVEQLSGYIISLMVALALAMIIAFHPQTYGKKASLSEIEAPKSLLFYAMIGSLVGATVADYGPQLGFIIFGLGGLMRFRTNTGPSNQTGRLILVALIGLCCGLKMLYIAAVSTLVGWMLIYFLERNTLYQIDLKKISDSSFGDTVTAYRHALKQQKCTVIKEKKNPTKGRISFIFKAPGKLRSEDIEMYFEQNIPEELRSPVDWSE